jgi:hypothetical protein
MAKTYSKASRVIVWLRETADNSDKALKAIRAVGKKFTNSLNKGIIQQAIPLLL